MSRVVNKWIQAFFSRVDMATASLAAHLCKYERILIYKTAGPSRLALASPYLRALICLLCINKIYNDLDCLEYFFSLQAPLCCLRRYQKNLALRTFGFKNSSLNNKKCIVFPIILEIGTNVDIFFLFTKITSVIAFFALFGFCVFCDPFSYKPWIRRYFAMHSFWALSYSLRNVFHV